MAEHKQDADKEIATLREQNSYLKAKVEELRIVEESITKNKDYSSRFNELEKKNVKAIQESSDRVLVHIKEAMAAVKTSRSFMLSSLLCLSRVQSGGKKRRLRRRNRCHLKFGRLQPCFNA